MVHLLLEIKCLFISYFRNNPTCLKVLLLRQWSKLIYERWFWFITGSGGLPSEGSNLGNGAPVVGDLRMTSIRPMTQPQPTTKTLPALAEVNHFLHNTSTHPQMKPLQQPSSKQISPKKASFKSRLVLAIGRYRAWISFFMHQSLWCQRWIRIWKIEITYVKKMQICLSTFSSYICMYPHSFQANAIFLTSDA